MYVLALAIPLTLLTPVFAQEDRGSRRPYVVYGGCGCCTPLGIWFLWWIIRGSWREFERGHKQGPTMEEVLDDIPKKKQVMFKGDKVPDWRTAARQKATKAALKFLSYTDNWFEKKYIADVADEAFRLIKEAIEGRSLKGIDRRVTPECLEDLRNEIKKIKREHELHIFGRVEVTDVDVLHLEAPTGKENHTFTALISAKSKDFYEDDETGELVRGDKKTYAYQEFWSFRRSKERWLVELIRPSSDLDAVLDAKNVLAKIDLEEFAKDTDPEHVKEFVGR
jgi:hypothetical protein